MSLFSANSTNDHKELTLHLSEQLICVDSLCHVVKFKIPIKVSRQFGISVKTCMVFLPQSAHVSSFNCLFMIIY